MVSIAGTEWATWQSVPTGLPAREALAYPCAFMSIATGIGLFKLRFIFLAPTVEGSYQSCGVTAVIVADSYCGLPWFSTP